MSPLSLKRSSERFGLSVGTGVFVALLLSGAGALWFSRAYYSNSGRMGWGDASADRNQSLFWWGTVISVSFLLLLVTITAILSERFRYAVGAAGVLVGTLMPLGQWSGHRYAAAVLLVPGIFASMMALGVHADLGKWAGFLWVFGVNIAFYAATIGGVLALLRGRKRSHEKAGS